MRGDVPDLAELGVPEHIASVLRERSYPERWKRYWSAYRGLSALLVVLSGVPAFALLWATDSIEAARAENAHFYAADHGPWVVVFLMPALTVAGGWGCCYLDRLFPPELREYLAVRGLTDPLAWPLNGWLCRRAARDPASTTPAAFLEACAVPVRRWAAVVAAVLTLLACGVLVYEMAVYDVGTDRGVDRHSLWGVTHVPYAAVEAVEVGCAACGRGTRPVYDLILGDGERISTQTGCGGPRLMNIASLDRRLREQGVVVRSARDSDGAPLVDARCERRLARCVGPTPELVHALLNP